MNTNDHNAPDEAYLLGQAREYDDNALTWIYQNYHDPIYRYLYRHLGEVQTAQDLSSDVFRRLLQALRNGGGPTRHLRAWLYRVAHNLIVDELRRRKHREHESLDGMFRDFLSADSPSLDDLAGRALTKERVRFALLGLTQDQRHVVVLKYLEGMSNAEAAEITGKTVGAVKSLQHRALDSLRAQLVTPQAPVPERPARVRMAAPSYGG